MQIILDIQALSDHEHVICSWGKQHQQNLESDRDRKRLLALIEIFPDVTNKRKIEGGREGGREIERERESERAREREREREIYIYIYRERAKEMERLCVCRERENENTQKETTRKSAQHRGSQELVELSCNSWQFVFCSGMAHNGSSQKDLEGQFPARLHGWSLEVCV